MTPDSGKVFNFFYDFEQKQKQLLAREEELDQREQQLNQQFGSICEETTDLECMKRNLSVKEQELKQLEAELRNKEQYLNYRETRIYKFCFKYSIKIHFPSRRIKIAAVRLYNRSPQYTAVAKKLQLTEEQVKDIIKKDRIADKLSLAVGSYWIRKRKKIAYQT